MDRPGVYQPGPEAVRQGCRDVLRSRGFRAGKRSRRAQLECQPDWQRGGQQFAEHHPTPECADADRRERGQQSGSDGDELANRTSGEDGIRADGC